jgi:glycogen debranching enzyme
MGYYASETRLLSRYELTINDEPVKHRLSVQTDANEWSSSGAILHSDIYGNLNEGEIPKGSLELGVLRKIEKGWRDRISVRNNGIDVKEIHFVLKLSSPISDIQGGEGVVPGIFPTIFRDGAALCARFERRFGVRRNPPTEELRSIYHERAPKAGDQVIRVLEIRAKSLNDRAKLEFIRGEVTELHVNARLDGREALELDLGFEPIIDGLRLPAPELKGLETLPRIAADRDASSLALSSSNSTFNLIVGQAMKDMRSLRLASFGRNIRDPGEKDDFCFVAGIPHYVGMFGRDNVIAAWQSALFDVGYLEPPLTRVANLQGIRWDNWRDEEPDRLPHEGRPGPFAAVGLINRDLYYGDVAATPFWVLGLTELYRWVGDLKKIRAHQGTLERCCNWIRRRLKDGGGFIYYAPAPGSEMDKNRNQAWKDSGDAVVDHEGCVRTPPLAMVEIQAYAYGALAQASELFVLLGKEKLASELKKEAAELKKRFNERFWMPEEEFYAFGLDRDGKQIRSRVSNVGHCLISGVIDEKRIEKVVQGLFKKDLFSGWGIRTLSRDNPAYDPFSYHRGSVWPVENAIIADGLSELGYREHSNLLITSQLSLASIFQHMRLPELFSGHGRSERMPTPGIYKSANPLQAWSVSAVAQYVQSILGIVPRADRGTLLLNPCLPEWLDWLEVESLRVGSSVLDLRFTREGKTSRWEVLKQDGAIHIQSGTLLSDPRIAS